MVMGVVPGLVTYRATDRLPSSKCRDFSRAHLKEGNGKGGYSHLLASTLSLGAVGPATVLSHKCDILSLLKDDLIVRDNRLPVHCRHLASRQHRTVIPVAMQMSLPLVCLPPVNGPNSPLRLQ